MYVHATCATDTSNIAFVMESVFDIILKDNLRKLAKADVSKITEAGEGNGISAVKTGPKVWDQDKGGKIILACAWYTDDLKSRDVIVNEGNVGQLPAVQLSLGLSIQASDWSWIMGLGAQLPVLPVNEKEKGSFKGNFKEAAAALRTLMGTEALGSVYDTPIIMKSGAFTTTVIVCVKCLKALDLPAGMTKASHEDFENAHYKAYAGVDTVANPCKAPAKNEEFNPFAPNPVGHRWFKGVTLFTKEISKAPDKGVYLGIFKVLSSTDGFKIMVNEHNRISIPMIFLTENQIDGADQTWMHGVRIRQDMFNIDLLEGKQPNRGWLGPEMSGEEGATFPEKLWWAIDEAKARLDTEDIGKQYDKELLFIDENDSIQLLLFGVLANEEADVLPGHIWVGRDVLEVQNMKYNCPKVLQGMLNEMQGKINEYQALAAQDAGDLDHAKELRKKKDGVKVEIERLFTAQSPLKWVNRVIMWCAEKMPSFAEGIKGANADEVVKLAMARNSEVDAEAKARTALLNKYKN